MATSLRVPLATEPDSGEARGKVPTMRHVCLASRALALLSAATGCSHRANVQCEVNPNCDLTTGGVCAAADTGNHWCSYPDPACSSGYRYSDQDVGDGVAGQCVAGAKIDDTDAGLDSSMPPASQPASCIALPHTCGPSDNDDCCNSPLVEGGDYFRGFDRASDSNSGNTLFPATISPFRLDKYEITVGRFRSFIEGNHGTQANPPAVGAGANPYFANSGWDATWDQFLPKTKEDLMMILDCGIGGVHTPTWTNAPRSNENLPINCISWYEAMAFCAWDGGFLPSEAEWNYAATGGSQQRAYPWSDPPSFTTMLDASYASYNCIEDGTASCAFTDILPVGSKPKGNGRWQQSDLGGNVTEWVMDWGENFVNPCTNCVYLGAHPDGEKELRGGSWFLDPAQLRTGHRLTAPPGENEIDRGARCARMP